jgi:hypothetical protein
MVFNGQGRTKITHHGTKKRHPRKDAVISDKVSGYFAAFFASAFLVTSNMIGVAMKIEA